jgi:AraC-like DNA-binding protein
MSDHNERALMSSNLSGFEAQENASNKEQSQNELTIVLNKAKPEVGQDRKTFLVEKIKKIVVDMVYYSEEQIKVNFSDYLSEKLGYNYTHMANLFSKIHGTSIQQFIIETKIERVKELLVYDNLTLTEISFKLYYSSVAHLSNQFKKVTGLNPSQFLATAAAYKNAKTNTTPTYPVDSSVVLSMVNPANNNYNNEGLKQMKG